MKKAVESSVTYLYPGEGTGNQAGTVEQMIDIAKLIRNSAEAACGDSPLCCDISVARHLWSVEADGAALRKALIALIASTAENMDGGTMRIRAENTTIGPGHVLPITEGTYVKIRIESQKNRLKAIARQRETPNGKGCGLTECCLIIQNCGGLIFDESRAGVKAATIVYLPASGNAETKKSGEVHGKIKVLIMDDEEIIRVVASNMLKHMGYEVDVAASGDDALSLYWIQKSLGRPFDAVILDLTIRGGMGGAETMKRLLAIDPEITAIVSSGYTRDPVMADFKRHGFKAALPKPYKLTELGEVLKSVVGNPQL